MQASNETETLRFVLLPDLISEAGYIPEINESTYPFAIPVLDSYAGIGIAFKCFWDHCKIPSFIGSEGSDHSWTERADGCLEDELVL